MWRPSCRPASPPEAVARRAQVDDREHGRRDHGRRGQGLVEYGLILVLTTVLTVVWLGVFGGAVAEALAAIAQAIDQATGGRCHRRSPEVPVPSSQFPPGARVPIVAEPSTEG